LALSTGTLTPTFASGTTAYTASVSNATTSITVTPTRSEANATITVNGTAVTSGNASGAINLTVGANTITTVVTAQDGTTKTYTVTVIRAGTVTGITFTANSFVFDGTPKSLAITGTLPAGTSVAYSNNSRTDVGTQQATATITGANFTTLELTEELKVTKAGVTITATNLIKVYGETNPALTFTYSGLVNSDTQVTTEPSIATTAMASSNAGTYPITLTGGSDQNYTITLVNGTLIVGKKDLTITAADKQKVYGEANPTLTFTFSGLVNADTQVTTEPSIATTATESSNVGTYPIELTGGADANYTITLVNGTLTVGKKDLTITAADKQKVYGEANPALTFTYSGLVNGNIGLTTGPSIATTATASSSAGA
jgi:hypothetical protein